MTDGTRWRHKKLGTEYEIVHMALMCDSYHKLFDNKTIVIYKSEFGNLFAREFSEFFDGRFEEIE